MRFSFSTNDDFQPEVVGSRNAPSPPPLPKFPNNSELVHDKTHGSSSSQRQKKPFSWVFLFVFLVSYKSLERNVRAASAAIKYGEEFEGKLDAPLLREQGVYEKENTAKQIPKGITQSPRSLIQEPPDEDARDTENFFVKVPADRYVQDPPREKEIQAKDAMAVQAAEDNIQEQMQSHGVNTAITSEISVIIPMESDLESKDLKCSPWEINTDDWWQQHPTWEPSEQLTNDTHTCFTPIRDPQRVAFLKKVYDRQFTHANCRINPFDNKDPDSMAIRGLTNIGFAATMYYKQQKAFYSAVNYHNRTYQYMSPSNNFHWLYVPQEKDSWAYCPSQDLSCYWLPITSCPRPVRNTVRDPAILQQHLNKKGKPKLQYQDYEGKPIKYDKEMNENATLAEQMIWLNRFLMRPRHELRRQFREFFKTAPKLTTPCTWIHVRRGDAVTGEYSVI